MFYCNFLPAGAKKQETKKIVMLRLPKKMLSSHLVENCHPKQGCEQVLCQSFFFVKPNQKPSALSAMASAAIRGSLPHVPA
jgi:hypothetical protein